MLVRFGTCALPAGLHTLPFHPHHVYDELLRLSGANQADILSTRLSGSRVASLKVPHDCMALHLPTPLVTDRGQLECLRR
jgi:hypothetical protein